MDKLRFRRGCALATTLCMLLTGCSLGAGSSEEKAASSVAAPSNAPAVEAPQTTASPVEQTGFGYEASGAMQVIDGAIFEKLVLLAEYFHVSTDYLLGITDDPAWRGGPD